MAPRSALTTPRLIAFEFPEIPLKMELKMNASPSGTTIPISRAERSRNRALRSFRQISTADRIRSPDPSVPKGPAGEVEENRLQVRFGDLHGFDGHSRGGRIAEDGRQVSPRVVHYQVDAVTG